jgi:RHS repeat-associated protein
MNPHPNTTPASPSLASPLTDAPFDTIESRTTTFATSVVPALETTTVTEVALGYHRNQQYSITAMTTSTGAVAERYAYTAYGQPTILNASGTPIGNQQSKIANRYTYTGREWDETLALHHFRARWRSPLAGRFLGRDPIGYFDGQALYRFAMAPLMFLDATGLSVADFFWNMLYGGIDFDFPWRDLAISIQSQGSGSCIDFSARVSLRRNVVQDAIVGLMSRRGGFGLPRCPSDLGLPSEFNNRHH